MRMHKVVLSASRGKPEIYNYIQDLQRKRNNVRDISRLLLKHLQQRTDGIHPEPVCVRDVHRLVLRVELAL